MPKHPSKELSDLQKAGFSDKESIEHFRSKGLSETQIDNLLEQSDLRKQTPKEQDIMHKETDPMQGTQGMQKSRLSDFSQQQTPAISQMHSQAQEQSPKQTQKQAPEITNLTNISPPQPSQPTQPFQPSQPAQQPQQPQQTHQPPTQIPQPSQPQESQPQQLQTISPEEIYSYYGGSSVEEIAESIIEEKWRAFEQNIGDIKAWKDSIERNILSMQKRIDHMDNNLTKIQAALLEKVQEYGSGMKLLGADMKAVEAALTKTLGPLLNNTKQLHEIIAKIKKKKSKR